MSEKHFFKAISVCVITLNFLCADIFAFPTDTNQLLALSSLTSTRLVRYRIIDGSSLVDDCLVCGRPAIRVPIRGSFWLKPIGQDMWFSYFAVCDLRFASDVAVPKYVGKMEGKYQIGGDFAYVHQMTLEGSINNISGLRFDSGTAFPQTPLPWIEIELKQISPTDPLHNFSIHLVAVPWPAISFSTENGFHPSDPNRIGKLFVSDGDLLSSTGRIVRTNSQLTRNLRIMPPAPDIGLDAVMRQVYLPTSVADRCRCQFLFSSEQDIFSETLGPLHAGDILSESGFIVRTYKDLIDPFIPMPPIADYGLDAVSFGPGKRLLFSTEEDFFSERLGVTIYNGDILCEDGSIYKTNALLMANFKPLEPKLKSYGLDALYIWPHGEIWFSTEEGFTDELLGPIGHGDLLSSIGRIVARNRELLRPFGPLEDLADFGLDGLDIARVPLRGDLDSDGDIDEQDLHLFWLSWLKNTADVQMNADLDIRIPADDFIDLRDFAALSENWLMCAE